MSTETQPLHLEGYLGTLSFAELRTMVLQANERMKSDAATISALKADLAQAQKSAEERLQRCALYGKDRAGLHRVLEKYEDQEPYADMALHEIMQAIVERMEKAEAALRDGARLTSLDSTKAGVNGSA